MLYNSVIGRIYCRIQGDCLTGISIGRNIYEDIKDTITLQSLKRELDDYFSGRLFEFKQRTLFVEGTDFQKSVWSLLPKIKYGETVSYKDIAVQIGLEGGYQAVGSAIGKNPIPIVVPCHRVVGSDGLLKGFSAGLPVKRWLLNHERRFNPYENISG